MAVWTRTKPVSGGKNVEAQRAVTMPDLLVVLTTAGMLFGVILTGFNNTMDSTHEEFTQMTLKTARDALIKFAAQNDGCLPFAADWEGGLSNTDQNGDPGYTDTGVARDNTRAGDLPWADLGLSKSFRDGDGLRIQYYVASQYADLGNGCVARSLGAEWNATVSYRGTVSDPLYVYYTPPGGARGLYEIDDTLPAGTRPDSLFLDIGDPLPASLLEQRRGPDIKKKGAESDVMSAQNVFVLLATGKNLSGFSSIDLPYMRDENHRANAGGSPWNLNNTVVDETRFAATHEFDANDHGSDGDDMLLVTSFLSFKSELRTFGVHLEPICKTAC